LNALNLPLDDVVNPHPPAGAGVGDGMCVYEVQHRGRPARVVKACGMERLRILRLSQYRSTILSIIEGPI
jgi:hypothetical protein